MALAVSISLSMPLSAAKFSSKELQPRKAPLAVLPCLANVRAESNFLHSYSTRAVLSTRTRHGHLASTNHYGELVFCCTIVNSSTQKTICGYWVGPDIDDGWGFIEAFVNSIT